MCQIFLNRQAFSDFSKKKNFSFHEKQIKGNLDFFFSGSFYAKKKSDCSPRQAQGII